MDEADTATTATDILCSLMSGAAACGGDAGAAISHAALCAQVQGVVVYRLEASERAGRDQLEHALTVLERRLQSPDLCQLETSLEADGTLTFRVASLSDEPLITNEILAPGRLDFYVVDQSRSTSQIEPGYAVLPDVAGAPVVVKWDSLLPPDPVESAEAEQRDWGWAVYLQLTDEARAAFADVTTDYLGYNIALVVDGVVLMKPLIQEPIRGGSMLISGSFDEQAATRLAAVLNGGSLPPGITLSIHALDVESLE